MKLHCKALIIGLLMVCHDGSGGVPANASHDNVADESMKLDESERRLAEALAGYVWGYYQRLNDVDRDRVEDFYLDAIANDPNSEFLIRELLSIWSVGGVDEKNKKIVEHFPEIADRNPKSVLLALTTAGADIVLGNHESAEQRLRQLFHRVKWSEPLLVRQLTICLLASNKIDEGHRFLRQATRAGNLGGNFIAEYAATEFYNTVVHSRDLKLTESKRSRFQERAIMHGIRAATAYDPSKNAGVGDVMELTRVLLEANHVNEAIDLLRRLEDSGYATVNSKKLLAECYEAAEQLDNALQLWRELSRGSPLNPYYHVRVGRVLKHLRRYNDAVFAYETAYRINGAPEIALEIAALYLTLNRPERARYFAERAPRNLPDTAIILSYIYRHSNQLEEALQILMSAQDLVERGKINKLLAIEFYLSLASIEYMLDRKDDIVDNLEKALALNSVHPEVNNFLGYFLAEEDRELDRAESHIRTALKHDAENGAYLDSLAWVLYRRGRFRQAAYYIELAIERLAADVDGVVYDHAGDIYQALNNQDAALYYWGRALEHEPKNADAIRQKIAAIKGERYEPR